MSPDISSVWHRWLFRSSPSLMVGSAYIIAVCIAQLDTSTGSAISLSALYFIPVAIVSWYGGGSAGIWLALACTFFSRLPVGSGDASFVWLNSLIRLFSLSVVAWLAAQVKRTTTRLMTQFARSRAANAGERAAEYQRKSAMEAFLHNSPELFCICNRQFVIYSMGSFWRKQLDRAEPAGRRFPEFLHPDDVGAAVFAFRDNKEVPRTFTARFLFGEGCVSRIEFSVRACPDQHLYLVEARPAMVGEEARFAIKSPQSITLM